MKYYIYLDVLFLRIFIMNLLSLISCGQIISCMYRWKKLIMAALGGTLINLLMMLYGSTFFGLPLVTACFMYYFSYGMGESFAEKSGPLVLIFIAMSMEGSVVWTGTYHSVWMIPFICRLVNRERKRKSNEMEVLLSFKGKEKRLKGFYDSGNCLTEPVTGKMVHIACYEDVAELLPECYRQEVEAYFKTGILNSTKVTELQMYEFTFLSYHSIGKENGQLLGIRMDSAQFSSCVGKKTEDRVVIGLTKQRLFVRGRDRIIVNGRMEL